MSRSKNKPKPMERKSMTLPRQHRLAAEYLADKAGLSFSAWIQQLIAREMERMQ